MILEIVPKPTNHHQLARKSLKLQKFEDLTPSSVNPWSEIRNHLKIANPHISTVNLHYNLKKQSRDSCQQKDLTSIVNQETRNITNQSLSPQILGGPNKIKHEFMFLLRGHLKAIYGGRNAK